ncbi:MAG: hypothetical protein IMHGJWDQ_001113 [Candidatus Fervidibacter sp.]
MMRWFATLSVGAVLLLVGCGFYGNCQNAVPVLGHPNRHLTPLCSLTTTRWRSREVRRHRHLPHFGASNRRGRVKIFVPSP